MKECPYTASSRDVSENTPPSALEISLVRGFCTPRPSRLPSGFALGQSLGPRGAKSPPLGNLLGLGGCIFRYIPPLGSVRIQYDLSLYVSHSILLCTVLRLINTNFIQSYCIGDINSNVNILEENNMQMDIKWH